MIDRHRPTFESIFNYYQYGGKLRRPEPVPDDIFLRELDFYQIEKEKIELYKKEEGYVSEKMVLPENPCKRKIWLLMEYPETSFAAYVIAIVSVVITVLSIILFCVETVPWLSSHDCVNGKPNFADRSLESTNFNHLNREPDITMLAVQKQLRAKHFLKM